MPSAAPVDLLAVERGGVREATHSGHLAVVDSQGQLLTSLGNPERVTFYRSSAKPLQALASLRAGIVDRFGLNAEHVAVIAASHNGEPRHIEVVRDLLARSEIPEQALQCGAHWPYYEPAAAKVRREMTEPLAVFNNCSGKHAGMLAATKALGAPLGNYLDRDSPEQRGVQKAVSEFSGEPQAEIHWGTDGCSAPNAAIPLRAMAASLARFAGSGDAMATFIVKAMTTHPFLVGGTDRFDTILMEATGGRLLSKGGAAGLHCSVNLELNACLVIKLESGDGTYTSTAAVHALRALGWLDDRELGPLQRFVQPAVRNVRKLEVGTVGPIFELAPVRI
jgi:L-asparaginase II